MENFWIKLNTRKPMFNTREIIFSIHKHLVSMVASLRWSMLDAGWRSSKKERNLLYIRCNGDSLVGEEGYWALGASGARPQRAWSEQRLQDKVRGILCEEIQTLKLVWVLRARLFARTLLWMKGWYIYRVSCMEDILDLLS